MGVLVVVYQKNQWMINWVDGETEPKNPANPAYPNGIDVEMYKPGQTTCNVKLGYPAKRCGAYHLYCRVCQVGIIVTTAGRRDDPRSVKVACKIEGNEPMEHKAD